MPLLFTNDDPKAIVLKSKTSEMAMSTVRGDLYRSQGKNNQDCVASFSSGEMIIDMVCDGLGGYADQNGELAARYCCEEAEKITGLFSQKREPPEFFKTLVEQSVKRYEKEELGPNAGTTLLLSLTVGKKMTVFHLGDSRAMFFRPNGEFVAQTHDHKTEVFEERFRLTKYLYQADPEELLQQADEMLVNLEEFPEGLISILMSDGVTDNLKTSVDSPECQTMISELIKNSKNAENLCEKLLKKANERMALTGTPEGRQYDVKPDNSACIVRWFR